MDFLQLTTRLNIELNDLRLEFPTDCPDQGVTELGRACATIAMIFPEGMEERIQQVMSAFVSAHASVVVHRLTIMPYITKNISLYPSSSRQGNCHKFILPVPPSFCQRRRLPASEPCASDLPRKVPFA